MNRPIHIYNRDRNSGTRSYVQQNLLGGKAFSSASRDVSSTALLMAAVARSPGALGYGGVAYAEGAQIIRVSPRQGTVGVWPSRENVTGGDYPLSRPLYYYVNPNSIDRNLDAFLEWVISTNGQNVVEFVGYFPAPEKSESDTFQVQPLAARDFIELTPNTMKRHDFSFSVDAKQSNEMLKSGWVSVTVGFDENCRSLQNIPTIMAHIGDDAEVPMQMLEKTVYLRVRKKLLAETSILLVEEGAPQSGAVYSIPLGAFVK